MNNLCGTNSLPTAYVPGAKLSTHQLTLLSILNGDGVGGTASDTTITSEAYVEVLSPRPQMPPQAYQSILSDSSLSPLSLLNSRALTTPSVERPTEHTANFGAIGEGRPTHPQQPHSVSPIFFLDPDILDDSVFNESFYVERSTDYSAHFCYLNVTQTSPWDGYIADGFSPLQLSMVSESPPDVITPGHFSHNPPDDIAYDENRRPLYQLVDNILNSSTLRARNPKEVCQFLLTLSESWGFKITIYSIVESLLDNVIQCGFPGNYDLLTLCSTFMAEIGIKWHGQRRRMYLEFVAETFVDLFKDAWPNLFARDPLNHSLTSRACAFYGQLYLKGILSPTQLLTCYDVIRECPPDCRPPWAVHYLTSGDMRSFEPLSL